MHIYTYNKRRRIPFFKKDFRTDILQKYKLFKQIYYILSCASSCTKFQCFIDNPIRQLIPAHTYAITELCSRPLAFGHLSPLVSFLSTKLLGGGRRQQNFLSNEVSYQYPVLTHDLKNHYASRLSLCTLSSYKIMVDKYIHQLQCISIIQNIHYTIYYLAYSYTYQLLIIINYLYTRPDTFYYTFISIH